MSVVNENLVDFLVSKKKKDLEFILEQKNSDIYHVCSISSHELLDISSELFSQAMSNPDKTMAQMDNDLIQALDIIYEQSSNPQLFTKKEKVHLRLSNLLAIPWFQKRAVPRCEQAGDVIQLAATVTKTAAPRLLAWRHDVRCLKCGYTFPVTADHDQFYSPQTSGDLLSPGLQVAVNIFRLHMCES